MLCEELLMVPFMYVIANMMYELIDSLQPQYIQDFHHQSKQQKRTKMASLSDKKKEKYFSSFFDVN
jgi:hypothetical protein